MSNANIKRVKSTDIEFKDRLVAVNRVTKVTKGGRTFSFSAIVVVGNENGIVGYGLGKAKEVSAAIAKGIDDAKKNLIQVPVLKGTIPHAQEGKYSGSLVFMKPAAPGTGVIAGDAMRAVLKCWCEERVGKIQRLFQPSQCGEGYYQRPGSAPRSLHHRQSAWRTARHRIQRLKLQILFIYKTPTIWLGSFFM